MEDCEICGRKGGCVLVSIEGAQLTACSSCARGGKIIQTLDQPSYASNTQPKAFSEERIAEDYGTKIRSAREKKGMKLVDLAHKINEAESFLDKIEKEKLHPTIKVAKKLEKELGIILIETTKEVSASGIVGNSQKFKESTLADLLEKPKGK